jgi:hypothetical protein
MPVCDQRWQFDAPLTIATKSGTITRTDDCICTDQLVAGLLFEERTPSS